MELPMPFDREYTSGESLIWLQNSEALKRFEGTVDTRPGDRHGPSQLNPHRRGWMPSRVIAIDGSNITHKVKNGFPGAEAGLIVISVVRIDLSKLASAPPGAIPRPQLFRDMERARTVEAVLPGANVVRKHVRLDTPVRYFRSEIFHTLSNGHVSAGHESLLDTLRALTVGRKHPILCPNERCNSRLELRQGTFECNVCGELLYETDALRLDERFSEVGSNGEVHGEFRHLLEVLVLLNMLRYFADQDHEERVHYLQDAAFVLDGPLAMFGHTAWLTPYIREELQRISTFVKSHTGEHLALLGFEKSGKFCDHFEQIDWSDERGPRGLYEPGTAILPDRLYINRNIVYRPDDKKAHGADTYFGRKVLYKTSSGRHAVINTSMVTKQSEDFDRVDLLSYPRLADILDVMDHLSTYLYNDGFMPLVRAHAHAAIPLQKGCDILTSLFDDKTG
jgi:hypothetical protein